MEANFLSKKTLSMEEGKMFIRFIRKGSVVFNHYLSMF